MKKLMLAVVAALLAASAWARPSIFHLIRERCQTHKEAHCSGERDIYGRAWNPDRGDIGAAVYDCKGLMLMLK